MTADEWGRLANVSLLSILFGWMFWAAIRKKKRRADDGCVPDRSVGEPYRVYTTAHDLVVRARDVPATLAADTFLRARGWLLMESRVWHAKVAAAKEIAATIPATFDREVRDAFTGHDPADWAICLLIDHSGSMREDPILHAAATVRRVSDALVDFGVKVAVKGFSTVGWHGGRARQDWLWNGQPPYPGRLCALLHIEYNSYCERLSEDDWAVMAHPDILRENIDGEALEWAAAGLQERPEANRLLIVLSDGAPVDDATLMHNGTAYLERHLLSVIDRVEREGKVSLAGVGIGFQVDRYYDNSSSATTLSEMPQALIDVIRASVSATRQ